MLKKEPTEDKGGIMTKVLYQPLSGNDMPRFAGLSTYMRLPQILPADGRFADLDVAFIGVPFDIGTSHRPGARLAPREIRAESSLLRPCNLTTGDAPFNRMAVADAGDVAINTFNLRASIDIIEDYYRSVLSAGVVPLSMGGDHTIALPILRALAEVHGPLGLVHVDAHADCNDTMFGEPVAHGTPFRRAVEEGLLDGSRVVQLGLRGTGYGPNDLGWGRAQGFWSIMAADLWYQSLNPVMDKVRAHLGAGPVYLSFDIDGLDPSFAPGTGTPEIAGLSVQQGLEIIRGCKGLDLVGADLVEVCPPYDPSGNTSLLAANYLFEMLCVVPNASAM